MSRVEALLLGELPTDLQARLQWLEDAAAAVEAELGEDGRDGALCLRAALGAIRKWSQGPMDDPRELEVLVKALLARGLAASFDALSQRYRELARDRRTPERAQCGALAEAFKEAAAATRAGRPMPAEVLARLEKLRR